LKNVLLPQKKSVPEALNYDKCTLQEYLGTRILKNFEFFLFEMNFFMFSDYFNMMMLKINFKK